MKSAICNLNLRDLVIWPLLAAADKLIVAISRVKSGLKGPGVVALGSVNEALQAAGEGLAGRGHGKVNSGALMRVKPQCWFGVEG